MLGPVYNAAYNAPSVGSAVFAEAIGMFFLYAIFGEIRQVPSTLSRVVNVSIFGGVGVILIAASFVDISRAGGSELTGIIVALAIGLPLAGFEFSRWLKFRGSNTWPITEGTVESVDVREVHTRSTHYFILEAAYSYCISGEYYSGRFTRNFNSESEAWDYAETLKGRRVSLRVNPVKVDTSCLLGQ